jgi:hypothetical protein
MSILATLGKGLRFFLMSMGVSTYAKKPARVPEKTPPLPVETPPAAGPKPE